MRRTIAGKCEAPQYLRRLRQLLLASCENANSMQVCPQFLSSDFEYSYRRFMRGDRALAIAGRGTHGQEGRGAQLGCESGWGKGIR